MLSMNLSLRSKHTWLLLSVTVTCRSWLIVNDSKTKFWRGRHYGSGVTLYPIGPLMRRVASLYAMWGRRLPTSAGSLVARGKLDICSAPGIYRRIELRDEMVGSGAAGSNLLQMRTIVFPDLLESHNYLTRLHRQSLSVPSNAKDDLEDAQSYIVL